MIQYLLILRYTKEFRKNKICLNLLSRRPQCNIEPDAWTDVRVVILSEDLTLIQFVAKLCLKYRDNYIGRDWEVLGILTHPQPPLGPTRKPLIRNTTIPQIPHNLTGRIKQKRKDLRTVAHSLLCSLRCIRVGRGLQESLSVNHNSDVLVWRWLAVGRAVCLHISVGGEC